MGQDERTISDQDFLGELPRTEKIEERASCALDEGAQAPAESFKCVSVFSGADSQ